MATSTYLTPEHQALLDASAISPEVAAARGYRSVTADEVRPVFRSRARAGLLIPLYSVGSVRSDGEPSGYQLRPDSPRTDNKGRIVKYETPFGQPGIIDANPLTAAALIDPDTTLLITEGQRKTDAGVSAGLTVIGLQGVFNWKAAVSGSDPLPKRGKLATMTAAAWDQIPLRGRKVVLCFDSDVVTKAPVRLALRRLAAVLEDRGASVSAVRLPGGDEGIGLDDWLAAGHGGDDALSALLRLVDDSLLDADDDGPTGDAVVILDTLRANYTLGRAHQIGPFAVPIDGPNAPRPLGDGFQPELAHLYYEATGRAASPSQIRAALLVAQGEASRLDPIPAPSPRLATDPTTGASIVDLGTETGEVVVITPDGWEIAERSPVPILRVNTIPWETPIGGGNPFVLLDPFLHVSDVSERDLIVATLAAALIEDVIVPILWFAGPSGSGKTFMAKVASDLVAGTSTPFLRRRRGSEDDIIVGASAASLVVFDNIGTAEEKDASWNDLVAGLLTGAGFARRRLYSDSDVAGITLRRRIVLTSVEPLDGLAEDVKERAILISVPPFGQGSHGRSRHGDLDRAFKEAHPRLLGALLDLAVVGLSGLASPPPGADVEGLRFKDYGLFLAAIDARFGTRTLRTYRESLDSMLAERAALNPFVQAVIRAVDDNGGELKGSATEILQALSRSNVGHVGMTLDLQGGAVAVGKFLVRETHALGRAGIAVVQKKVKGIKTWHLYRTGPEDDGLPPLTPREVEVLDVLDSLDIPPHEHPSEVWHLLRSAEDWGVARQVADWYSPAEVTAAQERRAAEWSRSS